jgi:hypothetical protein
MDNKKLLIGIGLAFVAYLIWKKSTRNIGDDFTPFTAEELLKINAQNGYCQNPSPATIQGYNCFKDSKGNTWLKITKNGVVTWSDSQGKTYDKNGKDITIIMT